MIIITTKNGIDLKYKGNISLKIYDEFPHILWVTAKNNEKFSKDGFTWRSETWDNIFLDDIKSIRGE